MMNAVDTTNCVTTSTFLSVVPRRVERSERKDQIAPHHLIERREQLPYEAKHYDYTD